MEDLELSPEQLEIRARLQEFEEEKREKVKEELQSASTICTIQFKDECEFLNENVQAASVDGDHVIMNEEENEQLVFHKNMVYLEKILDFSLQKLFKEAKIKMSNIRITWKNTILEKSEEEIKILISDGYDRIVNMFAANCELCATRAVFLLKQAKGDYDNGEGVYGTANVLINFQYVAVVPIGEIVQILESIEESLPKLIDLLQDQNENNKGNEVENIHDLIRRWLKRDVEIQEKQLDLLRALKGHPADPELRQGMQDLMEEYLRVSADNHSAKILRFKLYAGVDNLDALQDLMPSISECYDQYKKLATRMSTFFEDSIRGRTLPEGQHYMV